MRHVDYFQAIVGNSNIMKTLNTIKGDVIVTDNSGSSCPSWTISICPDDEYANLHALQVLNEVYHQTDRICESYIRKNIPGIYQFIDNRPDTSFPAKWGDLMNIQYALEDFQPDLILEVGGGVSSVIFSSYSQTHGCDYLLVDPDQEWAKSTIDIIGSIKNLKAPNLLNLEVIPLYITELKKNTHIFDYNNSTILEYFRNSSRTLIFIDGAPRDSVFQGAEIALNKNLMDLVENGIILIDFRKTACKLLEQLPITQFLYSSNVDILINEKPFQSLHTTETALLPYILEDFCFSAFSIVKK